MVVECKDKDNKECLRNYTPVCYKPGEFEVVVKQYEGGVGSGHIHSLKVGDKSTFRGPMPPSYLFRDRRSQIKTLVLIAGGTGVAPMYSIAYAATCEEPKIGKIVFLGCYRDDDDILLESDVQRLGGPIEYSLILSRQKDAPKSDHKAKHVFQGRMTPEMITKVLGESTAEGTEVVCCGPPPFNDHVNNVFTKELKFSNEKVHLM